MIANNILELIGNTPLLKIKTDDNSADIYAKFERNNPSGSVKDRAILGMYEYAKNQGLINEDTIFIEATSGNTGIALAMLGASLNHRVILTMPESMSKERRDLLAAYGAELILTEASAGMKGADDKVKELLEQNPKALQLSQFENIGNPTKHFHSTAIEILNDIKDFDVFITGVGTGGTISGVSKYFKDNNLNIKTIAIEPIQSAVITTGVKGPHKIQGIGAGYIPDNYLADYIDEVRTIDQVDAINETKNLIKSDGLFVGISAGANIFKAKKVAKELGSGHIVVTIIPDDGVKYISTGIYN